MKHLFGAIACYFRGHKRGKSWGEEIDGSWLYRVFACPRCGRTTRYKHKSLSGGGMPADGSPHFRERG